MRGSKRSELSSSGVRISSRSQASWPIWLERSWSSPKISLTLNSILGGKCPVFYYKNSKAISIAVRNVFSYFLLSYKILGVFAYYDSEL